MRFTSLATIALVAPALPAAPDPKAQTFALTDSSDLVANGLKIEAVEYKGRKAVRLTKDMSHAPRRPALVDM